MAWTQPRNISDESGKKEQMGRRVEKRNAGRACPTSPGALTAWLPVGNGTHANGVDEKRGQ
jgi:hypothetical protein